MIGRLMQRIVFVVTVSVVNVVLLIMDIVCNVPSFLIDPVLNANASICDECNVVFDGDGSLLAIHDNEYDGDE
jgi:hypothetical protein